LFNDTAAPSTEPAPPLAVTVLRWPAQDRERRRLAVLGRPRILLTDPDVAPPSLLDDRELWLQGGGSARDLADAIEQLRRHAGPGRGRPLLDEGGRLRYDGRWVAVPPAQVGVVTVLLEEYQRVVPLDRLRRVYRRGGAEVSYASIGSLAQRLHARVAPIGLRIDSLRRRGVMLSPAMSRVVVSLTEPPTHAPDQGIQAPMSM
jgi:hypothetical protein